MEYLIGIAVCIAAAVGISIPWVHTIDKQTKDPDWQQHKDDPDYWDWP